MIWLCANCAVERLPVDGVFGERCGNCGTTDAPVSFDLPAGLPEFWTEEGEAK